MTVNVYTYYANKLALQEAGRNARSRPRPKRARRQGPLVSRLVLTGLALGLASGSVATVLLCPEQPPYLLLLAVSWGGTLGWLLERFRRRVVKFMAALKGDPLQSDDLVALTGRTFGRSAARAPSSAPTHLAERPLQGRSLAGVPGVACDSGVHRLGSGVRPASTGVRRVTSPTTGLQRSTGVHTGSRATRSPLPTRLQH